MYNEEEQVVNQEVESTEPQEQAVNESESATDEQSEATEQQAAHEQAVPYERFKEVNDRQKYYEEMNQQLIQQLASRQAQGERPQEVEDDLYAGMTAEEEAIARKWDKRTEKMILREAQKLAQPLQKRLENQALQVSKLLEQNFRQVNKDVEPNSVEEKQIAQLVQNGISLEQATWAVMGPKRVAQAKNQKQQAKSQKTQEKAKANTEKTSIPAHNPLPKPERKDFRAELDAKLKAAGV